MVLRFKSALSLGAVNTTDASEVSYTKNGQTNVDGALDVLFNSGGGGGTTDYTLLSSKPQINGVTLLGNKTSKQLLITDNNFTDTLKAKLENITMGGNVNTYADLLLLTVEVGTIYFVTTDSGSKWTLSFKPRGFYIYTGTTWDQAEKYIKCATSSDQLDPEWTNATNGGASLYPINTMNNYNGILYVNITGVNTDVAPNLDTTNWKPALYDELLLKVDKVDGKELSSNDFTDTLKQKLDNIEDGAQVNLIETISKNSVNITPISKNVNITVPTKTSDITNDSNYVVDSAYVHTDNNFTNTLKSKLDGIEAGAQVNDIEVIKLNTVTQTITDKTIDLTISKSTVGLGNVDNTSDVNKPISTATQNAIDIKEDVFIGIDYLTPITVSVNKTTRVVTIVPTLGYFNFYVFNTALNKVVKHTKTGNFDFTAFTNTNGIWYFYFDENGNAITSQTSYSISYLNVAIFRLVWLTSLADTVFEVIEYHDNTISVNDHVWKHKYGTIWLNGFDAVHNALSTGSPNANGTNTVVSITSGSNMDDNLPYTITNSNNNLNFNQDLGEVVKANLTSTNSALFRNIYYSNTGLLQIQTATRFPFLYSANSIPEIVIAGVRTEVPNNNYFIVFLYALQDQKQGCGITSAMYPTTYTTVENANLITWNDLKSTFPSLGDPEIRPIYKLVYERKTIYNVACKYSVLRNVTDYRRDIVAQSVSNATTQIASNVIFTPYDGIASTNVQSAIQEVADERATLNTATISANGLMSSTDKVKLDAITGTNTGDQDLSGLMVKSQNLADVSNQQTALNNITAVSSATNEYVLTKDTSTGNAIFKASAGGGLTSVAVSSPFTGNGTSGSPLNLPDGTTATRGLITTTQVQQIIDTADAIVGLSTLQQTALGLIG